MSDRLDAFRNGRFKGEVVCPQPMKWNALWEMLPDRVQHGAGWQPPLPLILDGWWYSTNEQKRERFQSHLDWASSHGAGDTIYDFLDSLEPQDWYSA